MVIRTAIIQSRWSYIYMYIYIYIFNQVGSCKIFDKNSINSKILNQSRTLYSLVEDIAPSVLISFKFRLETDFWVITIQSYTQNTGCRCRCRWSSAAATNELFPSLLWVLNESYIYKRIPKQISAWCAARYWNCMGPKEKN
jgi:hypothetical protein